MIVEIDPHSGFCFGVVRAIGLAQEELRAGGPLHCLGEIVHNNQELERLKNLGLRTITPDQMANAQGARLMFRAHGEPPASYRRARDLGIDPLDATCPVVLRLQAKVKQGWGRARSRQGQLVIYGKHGHAEAIGLMGQTDNQALLIGSLAELDRVDPGRPVELFAQTTMSPHDYQAIAQALRERMVARLGAQEVPLRVHHTICSQVRNRQRTLVEFAGRFDAMLFVGSPNSSNGRMLYELCLSVNRNTRFIHSPGAVDPQWLLGVSSIGVSGATSTPRWLMEQVAARIGELCAHPPSGHPPAQPPPG